MLARTSRTNAITITIGASAVLAVAALLAARHSAAAGWWTLSAFAAAATIAFVRPSLPALSLRREGERFEITSWGVRRYERKRQEDAIAWSELEQVAIVTTPQGPTSEDLYFVLRGRGGAGVIIRREAAMRSGVASALEEHLSQFDRAALNAALQNTGDGLFVIWEAAVSARNT
ncbi:MAG TPA: hypothetical protein VE861_12525 [Gemmatimonadaceae bacterium]|nr:hypothetical protein [Gemmatimonadaceae bacterium]